MATNPSHDGKKNIKILSPDPTTTARLDQLNIREGDAIDSVVNKLKSVMPRFPPHQTLPCANVQAEKYEVCEKPGSQACSGCKLVSYCSKTCQKEHWRIHKRDCKSPMNSPDWVPSFAEERRKPTFISDDSETPKEEFDRKRKNRFSTGMLIWGNMPAMDVIKLADNENDLKQKLNVAFLGCRDFRNVLKTVTSLPEDYAGKLTILLNDTHVYQSCRNLITLLILGCMEDTVLAADIALHFCYSAFMPVEYRFRIREVLMKYFSQLAEGSPIPLGTSSQLFSQLDQDAQMYIGLCMTSSTSTEDAQQGYDGMRTEPSRADFRGRMYSALRPSHRVAFQEYRSFGLVLPFGAVNAHFNTPNFTLFSPTGEWLQNDYADPLEGFDTNEVIEVGKAYGANTEDIYGCLYFYLSDRFREFKRRLDRFSIRFTVTGLDFRALPALIRKNTLASINIPSSIRFNRISLVNLIDDNYVGLDDALTTWEPLLSYSKHSAIVGYFMNWVAVQYDADVQHASKSTIEQAAKRGLELQMDRFNDMKSRLGGNPTLMIAQMRALQTELTANIQPFYDTTPAFGAYLKKKNLQRILSKTKLQLRTNHKILPHRIGTAVGDPETALPRFANGNEFYLWTKLTSHTWWDRYVEFVRA